MHHVYFRYKYDIKVMSLLLLQMVVVVAVDDWTCDTLIMGFNL